MHIIIHLKYLKVLKRLKFTFYSSLKHHYYHYAFNHNISFKNGKTVFVFIAIRVNYMHDSWGGSR